VRVLVTGGAGFVGSHLVDRHLGEGDDVLVIDDFSTGRRDNLPSASSALTVVEGRVEATHDLDGLLEGVELIYHLAAAVGVFHVLEKPLDAIHRNLGASEAVFEVAANRGIRTIFTSTSEVYGKNDSGALSEGADSIFGSTSVSRWLYGLSKAVDECLALAYERERQLPVTILRLFNTTGPRQSGRYGMVVPRLVQQALDGGPLTVFGDGSQTRCFTNVSDAVECIVRLARADSAIGRVVNVGHTTEIEIRQLAERIRTMVAPGAAVELVDYATAYGSGYEDMRRRVPDVSLLRRLIGYVPDTPIEVTIEQIAEERRSTHRAGS
jgi:UDP-glucose 4-epimerase